MKRLALLLSLGLGLGADAAPMRWADSRDSSPYLQPHRPDTVTVRWGPAWQAVANEEHINLLDGEGALQGERLIAHSESCNIQTIDALHAQRPGDKKSLALKPHCAYWQLDQVELAAHVTCNLLGGDKGTRQQRADSSGASRLAKGSLRYFGTDNRSRDAPVNGHDRRLSLDRPGKTLLALSWSAS